MNFILKLSLSEIIKNKSKVLVAIIVTLILFMSAFTLCNISTALPGNFYRYYEEYMPDTIGVHIANADEKLYNNSQQYFEEFNVEFDIACSNYSLIFGGKVQESYKDFVDDEGNIMATFYYNNVLLSNNYPAEHFAKFFDQSLGGQGSVWDENFEQEGIWISDKAFNDDKYGKQVDIKPGDFIQYKYGNAFVDLQVKGIFNSEKLKEYMIAQSGNSSLGDFLCFITPTSAKKILFESETTFNAYGVVGKIDKLYDVYNTLNSQYSLSKGTAFAMIAQLKNTQVICMIVGIIMIICGIVIMLNFINMIISQNIKHISLLRILGTDAFKIMVAYTLIFLLLITIVCVISWMTLPLYNYFVSLYCASMGYPFSIGISYWVVFGVFVMCYVIICLVMVVKWAMMEKVTPSRNILEED